MIASDFYDQRETRSADERLVAQLAELKILIENSKSNPVYAERFDSIGLGDMDISDLGFLAKLPILRKSDLIGMQTAKPPFGGLNLMETGQLRHVYQSPGPINDYDGEGPDWWRAGRALYAAGFRPGDIVHNSFSYHFTPAGSLFDQAATSIGCAVFPAGTENTEAQARALATFGTTAYMGTPDFLPRLLEKLDELGLDTNSLTKAEVSAGPLFPSVRQGLNDRGIDVYQCYVIADLGLISYETPALEAMIVDEDVIVEIVRPGTGDPVPDGEVGEVVVTALSHHELPLIRLAIGDLSAIMPGQSPCGRTNMRLKGWLGRADQTAKVRGMFVHPEQVARVLKQCGLDGRARLVIGREGNHDIMTLHVEYAGDPEGLPDRLESAIKTVFNLRGYVRIEIPGALPNDGKLIDDTRDF
uniref:Phenylacetate-CoA ligase n=1 Tax=Candidatus Kentrum sp. TUN TaxID=2126343 RepID=A0A450ZN41_9GAMM|nr:MAG: phenylacetate-CoA ligase [Candidatus Kentron sp. TUN]VFK53363.1 MAG: phenylacetate-CoA ligase [Candidatus Kentron sp. TUN]VFK55204.1 MAG: phenylacetate-CoA ligase [Candidatus Kentron sp. TUN]